MKLTIDQLLAKDSTVLQVGANQLREIQKLGGTSDHVEVMLTREFAQAVAQYAMGLKKLADSSAFERVRDARLEADRLAALKEITQPDQLQALIEDSTLSYPVRAQAIRKYPTDSKWLADFALLPSYQLLRETAVSRIENRGWLYRIAMSAKTIPAREAAILRLAAGNHQKTLRVVAITVDVFELAILAVTHMTGNNSLYRVSRTRRDLSMAVNAQIKRLEEARP